jgi:hypothetical protein
MGWLLRVGRQRPTVGLRLSPLHLLQQQWVATWFLFKGRLAAGVCEGVFRDVLVLVTGPLIGKLKRRTKMLSGVHK